MSEGIRRGRPSMRGSSRPQTRVPAPLAGTTLYHNLPQPKAPAGKKRVLFICIGNSCRSQMAEGFARKFGADCMEVFSAGLSPASIVQPETFRTMRERGVLLEGQHPKGIELLLRQSFDVVVNMSGQPLPRMSGRILEWDIRDPIGQSDTVYRTVAEEIERRVMRLILELRS